MSPIDPAQRHGSGMAAFSAVDYCRLAKECFLLAAVARDPDAAKRLASTAEQYLQRAPGWLFDRLRK